MNEYLIIAILNDLVQKEKIFSLGNGSYMLKETFEAKYRSAGDIVNDWFQETIESGQLVHDGYIASRTEIVNKYNNDICCSIIKCFVKGVKQINGVCGFFYKGELCEEFKKIESIKDAIDLCQTTRLEGQTMLDYATMCEAELAAKGILIEARILSRRMSQF